MVDESVLEKVINCKTPEELYGQTDDDPQDHVENSYKYWRKLLHPDKNGGSELSTKAFAQLQELHKVAQLRAANGTYGAKSFLATITSTYKYDLVSLIASTAIADVYECLIDDRRKGRFVISKLPKLNKYFKKDRVALDELKTEPAFSNQIPNLIESFTYSSKGKFRAVSVYEIDPLFVSMAEIAAMYPDGIPDKTFAWIYRRLLDVIGYSNSLNIIHGGLTPDSILVGAEDAHDVMLVNWFQSGKMNTDKLSFIETKYKNFYPPEVFDKNPLNRTTDLFMASKVMMEICKPQNRILIGFLESCYPNKITSRPREAWEVYRQFSDLIDKIWPVREYSPLIMKEVP